MEAQVSQSNAISQKSEREVITLRESMKHLSAGWKQELDGLRSDIMKREERCRKECEEIGEKYRKLVELVKKERAEYASVKEFKAALERIATEWESSLKAQLAELKAGLSKSQVESELAGKIAQYVSILSSLSAVRSGLNHAQGRIK